jgi:chromate reductase, NAD(P)H dehydrogenase (quinone)
MESLKILALTGSLRQASYNTAALIALEKLAPEHVDVMLYEGIGELPLFNPDLEGQAIPAFDDLRGALAESHGLIIASPEYAHGISGVLKNALDWLVSGEEFVNMPVALINTSPRARHAQAALREVIKTMSGNIIEKACVSLPLLGSNLDGNGIVNEQALCALLKSGLSEFCASIRRLNNKGA